MITLKFRGDESFPGKGEGESAESGTCKALVGFIGLESRYPGVHLTPDMFNLE